MKWKIVVDGRTVYGEHPVHLVQSVDSKHQVSNAVCLAVDAVLSGGYVDISLRIHQEVE